ncbi:MAG: DUF1446 domain-containing protein [Parachlamydiaceae bacterium]|nr:DUF1446 domain-containing protein [Parachlamydiaceae bacterium]
MPILRIANAQAFWGDSQDAAKNLLSQQPNLDYITLDYLSEVSLSIMAIQCEKDPSGGYAKDFVETLKSLIPFWKMGSKVKIITNAGGLNPIGCAKECQRELIAAGLNHLKVGVVYGDDILGVLKQNPDDPNFNHLDTGESLSSIKERLVTANAYLGAEPIVDLLKQDADIVITGRVADPSLTVAPCIAYFGWNLTGYQKIAQATVAGHLIECGTQVTGGISTNWLSLTDHANIGFPFIEMESNGSFVITKPAGTGGKVDCETVKEQLLYEIGDPADYLSPDVKVSFLTLKLEMDGKDRVRISGASGSAPPPIYKVNATYHDGWKVNAILTIFGRDAEKKAQLSGEIIFQRLSQKGIVPERTLIECLGVAGNPSAIECVLHVAAADQEKEPLEAFAKEIAPMVTSGAPGTSGYTFGRPHLRQVFGFWPCLVECSQVKPETLLLSTETRL